MKKFLSIMLCVLCTQLCISQITITNANLLDAGYYAVMAYDTSLTSTLTPGPAGANQNWDFSGITHIYRDTAWFMMPDWTPYNNYFPNSNFAGFGMGEDMYMYFYRDNSEFSILGIVMYVAQLLDTFEIKIEPKETMIYFPANYLDSHTQNYNQEVKIPSPYPGYDSVKMVTSTEKITHIDGWGNVITPLGTFPSLRFSESKIQDNQTWVLVNSVWTMISSAIDTAYSYTWWTNDPNARFPVLEIYMDDNNTYVESYNYLAENTAMNIQERYSELKINAYPNPSDGIFHLSFSEPVAGQIEIVDLNGKLVYSAEHEGKSTELNLGFLAPGYYTMMIKNNNFLIHNRKICIK